MASVPRSDAARARVAVLSLHTSPLDQPGTGDSGGMNVYVRTLAERLAQRGVAADVFTRCSGRGVPEVEPVGPLTRVVQVQAGPCAPVPKPDLPGLLAEFARRVLGAGERPYDLIHAHYWLSGWAGRELRARWGIPLVASFHTLGKVKDLAGAADPEPARRLAGERAVVRAADRILASTPAEAAHLAGLYGARPDRIRVVPPGVDGERFRPRPATAARRSLGLQGRIVLFVGRLQPLKGPDLAIRAFAEATARRPDLTADLSLLVVGGASGPHASAAEPARLRALAGRLGVGDRVAFRPPVPHDRLPELYAAAEVVLVPSRSESFGLVALEAQACGVPVVASSVGGLRYVVAHGETGFLVSPDPGAFAVRLLDVVAHPFLASRLSQAAARRAAGFSWDRTADLVLSAYGEVASHIRRDGQAVVGA